MSGRLVAPDLLEASSLETITQQLAHHKVQLPSAHGVFDGPATVYVSACVCAYVYMHVGTHVCICMCEHVCLQVQLWIVTVLQEPRVSLTCSSQFRAIELDPWESKDYSALSTRLLNTLHIVELIDCFFFFLSWNLVCMDHLAKEEISSTLETHASYGTQNWESVCSLGQPHILLNWELSLSGAVVLILSHLVTVLETLGNGIRESSLWATKGNTEDRHSYLCRSVFLVITHTADRWHVDHFMEWPALILRRNNFIYDVNQYPVVCYEDISLFAGRKFHLTNRSRKATTNLWPDFSEHAGSHFILEAKWGWVCSEHGWGTNSYCADIGRLQKHALPFCILLLW